MKSDRFDKDDNNEEYPIEVEFTKEFYHVPVKFTENHLTDRNTKELKWAYLVFKGGCKVDGNQNLYCSINPTFLYKNRSEKITLVDRFEKLSEQLFRPNDRYEHFKQIVPIENSKSYSGKKISLCITCEPVHIEERTAMHHLINSKRNFFYHFPECKVKNAEIIGGNWDTSETDI